MRGDQLSRQWQILRQLEESQNGLTAAEISEHLGVKLRTVYRDLEDLQNAGFPLYAEKSEKGNQWKFVDAYRFKLPLPFTLTEIMALHLGRDAFRTLKGTVFYQSITEMFEKVRATLSPQTLAFLDKIQKIFHMEGRPHKDYAKFTETINKINRAAVECRSIELAYRSLKSNRDTFRKIDPYKIRLFDGTIYIIAFCHLRKETRTFVLDRIRHLELTDEKFEVPEDFDFDEYIRHGFKVMNDDLHTVKIRVSRAWARYVSERIWHESQKATKRDDGTLELTFQVAGLDEIKQWILSLGPEAYVVEPEKLRQMIQSDLKKMIFQYEGVKVAGVASRGVRKRGTV